MLRRLLLALLLAGCKASTAHDGRDGGAGHDGGASAADLATAGLGDGFVAGGGGQHISGTFTNDQGSRDWRAYIPSGYVPGVAIPLVVFLHGCGESLDHAETATRLTALAESRTFIAVYPAQSLAANPSGCWNWFLTADQARDRGEPSLIAGVTRTIMSGFTVDAKRVFVVGPSAGACMTVIMGATYPDLYAALGVFFGCEFGGAPCGASGGPDPVTQGQSAYQAMGTNARVVPVIVFQGDADPAVAPINGQQVIDQWIATDDYADDGAHNGSIATMPSAHDSGQVAGGESWDRDRYALGDGTLLMEHWLIHGMGHAWPGGDGAQSFTDPKGPDGTTLAYDFLLAHARP